MCPLQKQLPHLPRGFRFLPGQWVGSLFETDDPRGGFSWEGRKRKCHKPLRAALPLQSVKRLSAHSRDVSLPQACFPRQLISALGGTSSCISVPWLRVGTLPRQPPARHLLLWALHLSCLTPDPSSHNPCSVLSPCLGTQVHARSLCSFQFLEDARSSFEVSSSVTLCGGGGRTI